MQHSESEREKDGYKKETNQINTWFKYYFLYSGTIYIIFIVLCVCTIFFNTDIFVFHIFVL